MVDCFDPNTFTIKIYVSLVKWLAESACIIDEKSTILHELNLTIFERCSSLRSVIHDRETLALCFIPKLNCRDNWIEVGCNI